MMIIDLISFNTKCKLIRTGSLVTHTASFEYLSLGNGATWFTLALINNVLVKCGKIAENGTNPTHEENPVNPEGSQDPPLEERVALLVDRVLEQCQDGNGKGKYCS